MQAKPQVAVAVAIFLLTSALAACSSSEDALVAGRPNATMDNVRGQLALSQRPDGKKAFTFLVAADAHKTSAPAARLEKARMDVLAGQLGKARHCPRGYVVEKRTEIKEPFGMINYQGYCT